VRKDGDQNTIRVQHLINMESAIEIFMVANTFPFQVRAPFLLQPFQIFFLPLFKFLATGALIIFEEL
jgi:hypothetical protein